VSQTFERIVLERHEAVAHITLYRPEKRNALDGATVDELTRALAQCETDGVTRVILLRGAGPDFCAGADLAQLERIAEGADPLENLDDAMQLGELFVRMRRAPVPIIAAVQGNAIAGGAGLATAADAIIAADDAIFGYPEVHLGFVPAMVMALLRRSVGEKVAFDLTTSGRRFTADEGKRLGLVTEVVPTAELAERAETYARETAKKSASALRLIKRLLYGIDGMSFEDAIARGAEVNVLARSTPDCREGVRRFLERRRD
jgi:methylglutaconyl-CoA hydratase